MKTLIALMPIFYTLSLGFMCTFGSLEAMSLHEAAEKGNLERVKELLTLDKTRIDEQPKTFDTPLHLACRHGHLPIVEFLIANGANINAQNYWEMRPLQAACLAGHVKIVELLFNKGARWQDVFPPLLLLACDNETYTPGHLEVVKYLVENLVKKQQLSIDTTFLKLTALHAACNNGHLVLAQFLAANGATINTHDDEGQTPLSDSYKNKKWAITRWLLSKNASVCLQEGIQAPNGMLCREALYWEKLCQQEPEQETKDLCEHITTMKTSKSGLLCIWLRPTMAKLLVKKIKSFSPEALSTIMRNLFKHLADPCYDLDDTMVLADRLKKLVPNNLWSLGYNQAPWAFKKACRSTPRQLFGLLQAGKKCDIALTFI